MVDLIELERRGWDALVSGRGAEFYGRLLTADAITVVPGMVLDREQTLASWEGVPPWTTYTLSDEKVLRLDEGAALVTYQVSAGRAGAEGPYRGLLTSVYVNLQSEGHDEWRLAFHQQTPLPAEAVT